MKKIKVVFVHYELVCGGAEQALFDLVNLLDKEKFEVSVFVQRPGGAWEQKFLDAGIQLVYDYSCRQPTWNPVKKLGNFRKKMMVKKALHNGGAGLLDICCPGADIVVDNSAWDYPEISFPKGAKTVKYIHCDPASDPGWRKMVVEEQEWLSRFDRIVCVSKMVETSFVAITGRTEGVEMHHNPINSGVVQRKAMEPVTLPQDAPLLCAVGRLCKQKSFERLLVIHRHLLDEGIRHNLVIVGDGPDREFLERLIVTLGIQDSVILAGYQSNPYPYMKAAKFVVNSSLAEGLPVIAMEALCLGVPVVAPIPSVAEAFGEEGCGLITENNMESLEAGVRKMLTDEAFYLSCKEAAQRRSAFFDGKRMVREIEQMLLDCLK